MPAILALPFRFFLKESFSQEYLAQLLGAGIVVLTMLISLTIKKSKVLALWSGLLIGFGSIVWFLSATGSSWYLGQVAATFFLTLAIYEGLNKKRAYLIGICLGGAFLSRLHTILSLPFFLFLIYEKNWFKKFLQLALGLLPFVFFNFIYNYLRFGVIWDKAYTLIPGLTTEPWYQKGIFSLSYIPRNLKVIFTSLPVFKNEFPYLIPSLGGLSLWITTPAFIYSLRAKIKERVVQFSWLSIFLIGLVVFSHGSTGFAQFGYRFAVDFYPFLIFLTIKGVAKTGLMWHHWLLLTMGIIVNLWGVLWINKFGWIGF